MWREKIIEAKKSLGISTKTMSERMHLPEQTITRILSGKTPTPRIDTVLELGAAVGLSAHEIFEETTSVVSDKSIVTLQTELDALKIEYDRVIAENAILKDKNIFLHEKVESLKDEIIATHNYYIKLNSRD